MPRYFACICRLAFPLYFLLRLNLPGQLDAKPAPLSADTILPAASLQRDVVLLRAALEQLHPGLYRYRTSQEMDAAFAQLSRDMSHDRTLGEVFLRLTEFTAFIRCGHTVPSFFNQSKAINNALFDTGPRLPFYWTWIDKRRMIVTHDFTPNRTLPAGTEILSINGIPSSTILARLLPLARADGNNDAKRIDTMSVQGLDTYEAPDVYFPLIFKKWQAPFRLGVRSLREHRTRAIVVAGVTASDRRKESLGVLPDMSGPGPLFQASMLPNGALWLRMPDWAVFNSKWDWKGWLNRTLDVATTNQASAFIIDLRGNEGGLDEVGNVVLSHLRSNAAQPTPEYSPLVRYRRMPDELRPYLSTWDKSILDWGDRVTSLPLPWPTAPPVEYFRRVDNDDEEADGRRTATVQHFGGKVFVLIDASNSSATFNFALAVQEERLGVLVGQPTGGSLRGINGSAFIFLRLPGSGIEIDLPLVGTFPNEPQPDRGLVPDIAVRSTQMDIYSGRDRVLERVDALVRTAK